MAESLTSYALLGFKVTPTTKEQLLDLIADSMTNDKVRIIASQNLHGIYMFLTDEKFRSLHEDNRTCVHIDGTPIIWMGRLLGLPLQIRHRTAVIDWFMPLMKRAADNAWRVYYLGGDAEVLTLGLERIREAYPPLQVAGHHGFFEPRPDGAENRAVVEEINQFRPHVLIVGMGMGRQEHWIVDNLDKFKVNCICTVGACIEYFAGVAPIPPRWLGQIGLEWAYRFCTNPRRFAWRYLIEPWLTGWLILVYLLRRSLGAKR